MPADRPAPDRRQMLAGALSGGALGLFPGLAFAQTARVPLDSLIKGNTQGGTISINGVTERAGRVHFAVTLSLPAYFFNLDRYGETRGNFGSGDLQLYWKGRTFGTEGDARGIGATTLVHVETWTSQDLLFEKVRRPVASRTYRVELRFETRWDRATGQARLQLAGLRMPGAEPAALRAVRAMVDWYTDDTVLRLHNLDRLTRLAPQVAETRYAVAGRGAGFDCVVRLSLDGAALRRMAAERGVMDLQDPRLWQALISMVLAG